MIKIKPIMTVKDGDAVIVAKERGNKRVLHHFIREFNARIDEDMTDFVILGYTTDISGAERLKEKLSQETDFKGEIYIMRMGMTVGNHIGRGGVSMFFVEKGHRKDGLLINEINALMDKKDELLAKIKSKL